MGKRENKVETYFKKSVERIGGLARKWVSPGHDGVTDEIAIVDGVVHFVEIKTVDGKLSSVQKREQERLRKVGANVHTVYGEDGVDEFMTEVVKPKAPVDLMEITKEVIEDG